MLLIKLIGKSIMSINDGLPPLVCINQGGVNHIIVWQCRLSNKPMNKETCNSSIYHIQKHKGQNTVFRKFSLTVLTPLQVYFLLPHREDSGCQESHSRGLQFFRREESGNICQTTETCRNSPPEPPYCIEQNYIINKNDLRNM